MQTFFKMRIHLHKMIVKIWQKHKDKPLVIFLQKSRKNKLNAYFMQKTNLSAYCKGIYKKRSRETPLRDLKSKQLLPTWTNKKHAPTHSESPTYHSTYLIVLQTTRPISYNNLNTPIRTSHRLHSSQGHNNHYINFKIHQIYMMHS